MKDLASALGLVLVLEGALYAVAPDGMARAMKQVSEVPVPVLRRVGIGALVAGFGLIAVVRALLR